MKKLLSAALSAVIILGLSACGTGSATTTENPTENPTEQPANAAETGEDSTASNNGITGEITISCYETMTYSRYLNAAKTAFEEKYPGTTVNIETFSAMPEVRTSSSSDGGGRMMTAVMMVDEGDDPKAKSDYLTQINTDMISGGGADIYANDIIPFYKYALNGQLEDLQNFMNNDASFDINDYQKNIFEAAKFNGGQYILPMDYSFDVLSYDSTIMSAEAQSNFSPDGKYSYEQLVDIGLDSFLANYDADAESPLKMFNLYSDLNDIGSSFIGKVFNANYSSFVDIVNKKANFTDGSFVGLLNLAKEYEEKGYLNARLSMESGGMLDASSMREMMQRASSQSYLYKSTNQMMLLQAFNTDETTNTVRGFAIGGGGGITENDVLSGMLSNDKGEASFTTSQSYTINANSKNKETAWEFLKFLLSEEMQTTMYLSNIPVNKSAAAEKTKQQITGELYGAMRLAAADFAGGERGGRQRTDDSEPIMNDENTAPENLEEVTIGDEEGSEQPFSGEPDTDANVSNGVFSFEDLIAGAEIGTSNGEPIELTEAQQETYDKYMAAIEVYASMLNSYMIHDTTVDDMIKAEVANYFDGSRTAEEVAAALQNKVGMYLQE